MRFQSQVLRCLLTIFAHCLRKTFKNVLDVFLTNAFKHIFHVVTSNIVISSIIITKNPNFVKWFLKNISFGPLLSPKSIL